MFFCHQEFLIAKRKINKGQSGNKHHLKAIFSFFNISKRIFRSFKIQIILRLEQTEHSKTWDCSKLVTFRRTALWLAHFNELLFSLSISNDKTT